METGPVGKVSDETTKGGTRDMRWGRLKVGKNLYYAETSVRRVRRGIARVRESRSSTQVTGRGHRPKG